jgi:hypothetical protein
MPRSIKDAKMQIIRTTTEVSELQRTELAVGEAEAKVADWRRSVATIEGQLHAAGLTLTKAKEDREAHAMSARLGDATAKAAIARARTETHAAEQDVIDLQIALPESQTQLASAEREAAAARHALAMAKARERMKERIVVAGEIDAVIADLTKLIVKFEGLGQEISNTDSRTNAFGMSNHESAIGLRRVRAALPKIFDRIYPNAAYDEMKKEKLSTAEAAHWNLPPEHDEKAA